jgi:hypothetical protein
MRRTLFILVAIVVVAVFCLFFWLLIGFRIAYARAYKSFVASRPGVRSSIDSYEFASRGIELGQTEAEVDQRMRGAKIRSGRRVGPGIEPDEFFCMYVFEYGPTYKFPLLKRPLKCIDEQYLVFFDKAGGAVGMERSLYMRGRIRKWKRTIIDLRKKTVSDATEGYTFPPSFR